MTFSASLNNIEKLTEDLLPKVNCSPSFIIAPETCLDTFDEYFKCLICLQVIQKPSQCSQLRCDSLFCGKCIKGWLKNHSDCPICKSDFKSSEIINRFALNTLNAYKFECQECRLPYTYEKSREHLLECLGKEFECPLKCKDSHKFHNTAKLAKHLEETCPEMQLQCSICKETETRANLSSHDWCPIELKKRNVELVELQAAHDKLKEEMKLKND